MTFENYRYAVYAVPEPGSALACFGKGWFGGDTETGVDGHSYGMIDIPFTLRRSCVNIARRYGFHATLKAPFRLVDSSSSQELTDAVETLARKHRPIRNIRLKLETLDGFLALVPERQCLAIAALESACVRELDHFRAPISDEDVLRRDLSTLSPAQRRNFETCGYPYTLDEFRFHLTLTDRIDARIADSLELTLRQNLSQAMMSGLDIDHLCVVAEPRKGADFVIVSRVALGGKDPTEA